ncbi:MAG: cupin domain-containing protein [Putridiphycobacter sp.]|nr:cupin domain-containing protein [Putridiphycobacter sp.]
MKKIVQKIVQHYHMEEHPEGGWFKEIYRASTNCNNHKQVTRSLLTSIYFLLTNDNASKFHSIESDELWYYHSGEGFTVHCISPEGKYNTIKIGPNFEKGEVFQAVVPRGTIFGSTVEKKDAYALVSCAVAPGFDFADFKLYSRSELLARFPQHETIINRLT